MPVQVKNNATTTLASAATAGATSFTCVNAGVFPDVSKSSDYMYVTVGQEVVKVTSVSGNTCVCSALVSNHSAGENAQIRITAELFEDIRDSGASVEYVDDSIDEITLLGL